MIGLKLNQADVNRIKQKINNIKNVDAPGHLVFKYRMNFLNAYADAIQSVMGEVHYTGGSETSDLILGKSFKVNWEGLSPTTVEIKREHGWELEIWEASGDTKRAVKVQGNFAGISASTGKLEYEKALKAEFGDFNAFTQNRQPKRALFTLANELVLANKHIILAEIKKLIKVDIGWGK